MTILYFLLIILLGVTFLKAIGKIVRIMAVVVVVAIVYVLLFTDSTPKDEEAEFGAIIATVQLEQGERVNGYINS